MLCPFCKTEIEVAEADQTISECPRCAVKYTAGKQVERAQARMISSPLLRGGVGRPGFARLRGLAWRA